jgi:glycosyltransferase involved in cell wall biosynthesis
MEQPPEKIRILRVIARLNIGGPAIHTILLTKLLSPERFSSTLVTGQVSPSEGDMHYLAEEKNISPHVIPELGREIRWRDDLVALRKLYRLICTLRPTIVHTHTAKAGMLGRFAAKLAGVPIIVHTFHGHVFHSYFSPAKTRLFLWIERILGKLTDTILTVSPKQREEILSYHIGHHDKVRTIDLGLELQEFVNCHDRRGKLRQELGIDLDVPLIGIVARLVPVKGHTYFLEAAKHLIKRCPQVQCVIVGDGELRNSLEQLTNTLGIRSHIHFLGWRRDLPEIYADLDLVVLSSLNEGSPVALIEAMAAGKPVVAPQVGGISDLVLHEKTGVLVPSKDSYALAQGILQVLALPVQDRVAMGKTGQARVYPKYHITTLVNNIETLYEELLTQKYSSKFS